MTPAQSEALDNIINTAAFLLGVVGLIYLLTL
jgi:hypothetical protein